MVCFVLKSFPIWSNSLVQEHITFRCPTIQAVSFLAKDMYQSMDDNIIRRYTIAICNSIYTQRSKYSIRLIRVIMMLTFVAERCRRNQFGTKSLIALTLSYHKFNTGFAHTTLSGHLTYKNSIGPESKDNAMCYQRNCHKTLLLASLLTDVTSPLIHFHREWPFDCWMSTPLTCLTVKEL
jgi:hypothetical protein